MITIARSLSRFAASALVALLAPLLSSVARAQPAAPDRASGAWEGTLTFGDVPVAFSVLFKRADAYDHATDGFSSFEQMLRQLVK